jgi:hypothetical protein
VTSARPHVLPVLLGALLLLVLGHLPAHALPRPGVGAASLGAPTSPPYALFLPAVALLVSIRWLVATVGTWLRRHRQPLWLRTGAGRGGRRPTHCA